MGAMRKPVAANVERDELPLKVLGVAILLAFLLLFAAANATIACKATLELSPDA